MWRAEFATTQQRREMKYKLPKRIRSAPVSRSLPMQPTRICKFAGIRRRIAIAKNQIETDEHLLKLVRIGSMQEPRRNVKSHKPRRSCSKLVLRFLHCDWPLKSS